MGICRHPAKNVKTIALLQGIIAFFLHLYKPPATEAGKILTIVNIAELVADNAGIGGKWFFYVSMIC